MWSVLAFGIQPPGAAIMEERPLPAALHKDRAIILWMTRAMDNPRSDGDGYTCPEFTRGSYRRGPTRISLVDTAAHRIINTITVSEGDFDLPYRIESGLVYPVPGTPKGSEGKPQLITLQDVDGDGVAAEFGLYDATSCSGLDTYVYAYLQARDRIVQYPFLIHEWNDPSSVRLTLVLLSASHCCVSA